MPTVFAQVKVSKPGFYSYTAPTAYKSQNAGDKDFMFSTPGTQDMALLMIARIKQSYKNNKELLASWLADMKDPQPGQPAFKVHNTGTIKVGGKEMVSALVSLHKDGDSVYQRQVMTMHKGHCVVLVNTYMGNYQRRDKEFLASLSKFRWL